MVKLSQITITNEILGSGLFGTVFLGKYKNKTYAVKIEKYSELYKKDFDTETKFATAVKDNKFFMKIYERKIINPCKHKQPKFKWFKFLNEDIKKKVKILTKSKKCIITLSEYLDGKDLNSYINKFRLKDYYKMLLDLYTAIKFIKKKGYIHGDLHLHNILCKKENNTYSFKIIDYGLVLHKSSKDSIFKLAPQYDTNSILINICMDNSILNKYLNKQTISHQNKKLKKLLNNKLYLQLKKQNKRLSQDDLLFLFMIKHEKQYLEIMLNNKNNKKHYIKYYFPREYIYFLVKYGYNIDQCIKNIKYLYDKSRK
jgi:serine/threonine protein kinase